MKLNLEDDTDYTGPGEMDDTRVYNKANELQTRDTDSNASVNYTLSHDAVGNLTDDGQANEYIYDVWGRVRFVHNQTPLPVSEYRYNGLNWRISVSHDTDSDDDIDASDIIWHFIHDERWRIVAVYRENDSDPKEQFVYHAAGQNGIGTASYIDDVILRDKDNSDDWEAAADATLEERLYYCQNWRHDVIALIDAAGGGTQVEQQRYEAYGVPYLFVAGDMTANGAINATDLTEIQALIDLPGYDVRADLDLDGDVDATDKSIATANSSKGAGREKLSVHSGNRKGYAGYEYDDSIVHVSYHVRHRVLDSTLGTWLARDPLVEIQTLAILARPVSIQQFATSPEYLSYWRSLRPLNDLYGYAVCNPIGYVDSTGLLPHWVAECGVGGVIGGVGGFIGGLFGSGGDLVAAGCGALGGAVNGCCTALVCANTGFCIQGACICGAIGSLIAQACSGDLDLTDYCFWISFVGDTLIGCAGGALAGGELEELVSLLVGIDFGALSALCNGIDNAFRGCRPN